MTTNYSGSPTGAGYNYGAPEPVHPPSGGGYGYQASGAGSGYCAPHPQWLALLQFQFQFQFGGRSKPITINYIHFAKLIRPFITF